MTHPTSPPHPPLPIAPEQPWLAPLAGFSDLSFRLLCREQGCAAACTEMVSAKGLIFNNMATERILTTNAEDHPLVVQVYGPDAQTLGRAMDLLLERGARYFDLNAGCSVPKVTKTGSGAALLREPETLTRIVATMIAKAGEGRVGVKLRLGWRPGEDVLPDLAKRLEDLGVAWLTLHPRWAAQGFSGRADWDRLARLREHVTVPIIASGDLFTAEDAVRCLQETGASGVMFARGALRDPAVFMRLQAALNGGQASVPSLAWIIRRHVQLIHEHGLPSRELLKMRTIVPRYVRHIDGCKELRQRLVMCSSWEELEHIVRDIERIEACPLV